MRKFSEEEYKTLTTSRLWQQRCWHVKHPTEPAGLVQWAVSLLCTSGQWGVSSKTGVTSHQCDETPSPGPEVGTLVRNIRGQAKGHIYFSYNGPGTAKRLAEVELYLLGIPAWMIYAVAYALHHF